MSTLEVFKVDDGGVHWVAAPHIGRAAAICAEAAGMTRSEWAAEDPTIEEVGPHRVISVRADEARVDCRSLDRPLPDEFSLRVEIEATAQQWADACGEGVICSTEF